MKVGGLMIPQITLSPSGRPTAPTTAGQSLAGLAPGVQPSSVGLPNDSVAELEERRREMYEKKLKREVHRLAGAMNMLHVLQRSLQLALERAGGAPSEDQKAQIKTLTDAINGFEHEIERGREQIAALEKALAGEIAYEDIPGN
jgi:hypothetical protein